MKRRKCESCGASLDANSMTCSYCGSSYHSDIKHKKKNAHHEQEHIKSHYKESEVFLYETNKYKKNRILAGILAILFGGFGVHKFYIGKNLQGFIYLFLVWTYVPIFVAFIEGILYFKCTQEEFFDRYVAQ